MRKDHISLVFVYKHLRTFTAQLDIVYLASMDGSLIRCMHSYLRLLFGRHVGVCQIKMKMITQTVLQHNPCARDDGVASNLFS
jgi:hypothetical protein